MKALAVTGMAFEASIISKAGMPTLFAANNVLLKQNLEQYFQQKVIERLVSIGTAGGLDPAFSVGQIVIARRVITTDTTIETDQVWSQYLFNILKRAHFSVCFQDIFSSKQAVQTVADKQQLYQNTSATAVDMESHIVADFAKKHHLPFVVCRVVLDPAHHAISSLALQGLTPEGSTRIQPILKGLIKQPWQLFPLMNLAYDAYRARNILRKIMNQSDFRAALLDFKDI